MTTHFPWARTAWALIAALLVAFCAFEAAKHGWPIGGTILVFALAPDLTLIGAFDTDRPGRLRPGRVAAYNAAHRLWAPLALAAIGAFVSLEVFAAALAWATHIAVDRAMGYGLRAADGAIRPVGHVRAGTPCTS